MWCLLFQQIFIQLLFCVCRNTTVNKKRRGTALMECIHGLRRYISTWQVVVNLRRKNTGGEGPEEVSFWEAGEGFWCLGIWAVPDWREGSSPSGDRTSRHMESKCKDLEMSIHLACLKKSDPLCLEWNKWGGYDRSCKGHRWMGCDRSHGIF